MREGLAQGEAVLEFEEPCCPKFAISDPVSPDRVSPWRIFNPEKQKW
jgi:hypothetical protein